MKTPPSQAPGSLSNHLQTLTGAVRNEPTTTLTGRTGTTTAPATILLNTPPALRQLLSEHQSVHRLLPQLSSTSVNWPATNPLTALLARLESPTSTLSSQQLHQLVSQWFATQPVTMLGQPTSALAGSWLQAIGPALQWLLYLRNEQRNSNSPALRQTLSTLLGNTSLPPSADIATLLQQLKGALHSIRLSQLHLVETAAQQQPEYYLCLPYKDQDKDAYLELLLKREARRQETDTSSPWRFTVRLNLLAHGPVLARGSYADGQVDIRFYTESLDGCERLHNTLDYLQQRLQTHGIEQPNLAVYQGEVPESLAPYPRQNSEKRSSYGR